MGQPINPARPPVAERLEHWFTYHAPSARQVEQHEAVRAAGLAFARVLAAQCPESADLSTAVRCAREAVLWANAAIACGGK